LDYSGQLCDLHRGTEVGVRTTFLIERKGEEPLEIEIDLCDGTDECLSKRVIAAIELLKNRGRVISGQKLEEWPEDPPTPPEDPAPVPAVPDGEKDPALKEEPKTEDPPKDREPVTSFLPPSEPFAPLLPVTTLEPWAGETLHHFLTRIKGEGVTDKHFVRLSLGLMDTSFMSKLKMGHSFSRDRLVHIAKVLDMEELPIFRMYITGCRDKAAATMRLQLTKGTDGLLYPKKDQDPLDLSSQEAGSGV
jgi:hypothetical protein